jgi:hypothetical protein
MICIACLVFWRFFFRWKDRQKDNKYINKREKRPLGEGLAALIGTVLRVAGDRTTFWSGWIRTSEIALVECAWIEPAACRECGTTNLAGLKKGGPAYDINN